MSQRVWRPASRYIVQRRADGAVLGTLHAWGIDLATVAASRRWGPAELDVRAWSRCGYRIRRAAIEREPWVALPSERARYCAEVDRG